MKMMPLSEFNQFPSRATRFARQEDLIITERDVPAFKLSRIVSDVAVPASNFDAELAAINQLLRDQGQPVPKEMIESGRSAISEVEW